VDAGNQTRLWLSASAAILGKPIMKCVVADLFVLAKLNLRFASCLPGLDMRKHLLVPCCTGLFHKLSPKYTAAQYKLKDVLWLRVTLLRLLLASNFQPLVGCGDKTHAFRIDELVLF
jgi:hypothetical protein